MSQSSRILVVSGVILTLVLMTLIGSDRLFSQSGEKPAGWEHGDKEGWKSETPPGWKNWDNAKRQSWQQALEQAKESIKKDEQTRIESALNTLEKTARKGVPIKDAQEAVKSGLDQGLGASDFEPLGKFVAEKHQQGLKGKDLAEVIHQETKRRKAEREAAREKMKAEKGIGKPEESKGKDKKKPKEEDKGVGNPEKGKGADKEKPKKEPKEEGKSKGKGKGTGHGK